jgi:FtsH-binding integral membrane protein
MTVSTLGATLLSVGVIAAFALFGGGAWMALKQRQRHKGGLMIVAALVLLVNVLIWTV